MEQHKSIEELFTLYLNDQVSPDELKILLSYFDIDENGELLKQLISKEFETLKYSGIIPDPKTLTVLKHLFKTIQKNKKK